MGLENGKSVDNGTSKLLRLNNLKLIEKITWLSLDKGLFVM